MPNDRRQLHSPLQPSAEYSFGRPIKLFYPFTPLTLEGTAAIITHEVAHMELAMRTSFGMFQGLLGYSAEYYRIPAELQNLYRATLQDTIDHSINFHEAYASACELTFAGKVGTDFYKQVSTSISSTSWGALNPLQIFTTFNIFQTFFTSGRFSATAANPAGDNQAIFIYNRFRTRFG